GELDGLDRFVQNAAARLAGNGRLAVITVHSLEDRVVKHTMRALAHADTGLQTLTKKPVTAGEAELDRNPRARSAKLRGLVRDMGGWREGDRWKPSSTPSRKTSGTTRSSARWTKRGSARCGGR